MSTAPAENHRNNVLGINLGDAQVASDLFAEATRSVALFNEAIAQLGDTAAELVLLRKYADICKIVHLLRARGSGQI